MYVKVNKNWRSNVNQLKRFGYNNWLPSQSISRAV
jgi:GTPase Era involved in 16S rRNA processing